MDLELEKHEENGEGDDPPPGPGQQQGAEQHAEHPGVNGMPGGIVPKAFG
jgi:hypothetical protein